ncbi:MAG: ABC transporter substrate-binding protein [Acidimicrobiales bacterium]
MHRATRPAAARLIVAIPVVLAMIVAVACSSGKSSDSGAGDQRHGGTLRLAVVASTVGTITGTAIDPTTVGPTDQDAMVLVDLTSDSLTSIDPKTAQPVPALASSWSADSAGTSWTFTLRDDATFADGSPVTALDVSTSLERIASKAGQSLAGARLDVIGGYGAFASGQAQHFSGISVKDDHTLVITTGAPDAELPLLLGSPLYGVVKLVSSSTGDDAGSTSSTAAGATTPAQVVGTGPFMIESGNDPLIHMTRSPGSAAQLDAVDAQRVTDSAAALKAVDAGQADWASIPPGEQASTQANPLPGVANGTFTVVFAPLGAEEFFGMNVASPTFANPQFRQAIVKAVNRDTVVTATIPGLGPSPRVIPTGVPGSSTDPCGDACKYDPDAAKALLAQAFPDGVIPTVEIDTDDDPGSIKLASVVQLGLASVGIPVELKAMPLADYQRFVTTGQQQLFRTGWVGLAPSGAAYLDPLFRSGSLDNTTSFSSPDIDTRLAAALATQDTDSRNKQYAAIESSILGQSPILPLGSYLTAVAISTGLQDYQPRLDGTFVIDPVWVGERSTASTG